jgi:hypothetical protein
MNSEVELGVPRRVVAFKDAPPRKLVERGIPHLLVKAFRLVNLI